MNLFGKYFDENEKVLKSLTKIYGVGKPTAEELCLTFGIGYDKKVKDLLKTKLENINNNNQRKKGNNSLDMWPILVKAIESGPKKYSSFLNLSEKNNLEELLVLASNTEHNSNIENESKVDLTANTSWTNTITKAITKYSDVESKSIYYKDIESKSKSLNSINNLNNKINKELSQELCETRARTFVRERIELEKKIKSYRGLRHIEGLPVRGQRTQTNAITARKPRFK